MLASCAVAHLESTPLLDTNNGEEQGGGPLAIVASLPATNVMPLVVVERQLSLETLDTVIASPFTTAALCFNRKSFKTPVIRFLMLVFGSVYREVQAYSVCRRALDLQEGPCMHVILYLNPQKHVVLCFGWNT